MTCKIEVLVPSEQLADLVRALKEKGLPEPYSQTVLGDSPRALLCLVLRDPDLAAAAGALRTAGPQSTLHILPVREALEPAAHPAPLRSRPAGAWHPWAA